MQKLLIILTKLGNLSIEQRLWLAPLYLLSAPVSLLTLLVRYRRLGVLLGHDYGNTLVTALADERQQRRAWRLGKLVEGLCKYTPWPSKCLVQAIITHWALCWHRIPHVLYIGICKAPEPNKPLACHAWLCIDRWVITGAEGHQAFKVIATYVSPNSLLAAPVLVAK